ncbi:MAG: leucine-rich repeat domain-containing protein [Lachnospiraceae bacterium]|nr:leucine-rich repeat domain-containing protein [Lachnospiraceae bacterium]
MKKKHKITMLTLAMTLAAASSLYMSEVPVWAGQGAEESLDPQGDTKNGKCGKNVSYSLDTETGVMVISGTEKMTDYLYSPPDYYFDAGLIKKVIIEKGVTSIGDRAFQGCLSMTDIEIPDSVVSIGMCAFSGCESLTNIKLPAGVSSIEASAFQACRALKELEIPAGVTEIKDGTFSECESLTHITIPESVTSIGETAFYACGKLTDVEITNKDCVIADKTFVIYDEESDTYKPIPGLKIHAPKGSKAEAYAAKNGITFEATQGSSDPQPDPAPDPTPDPSGKENDPSKDPQGGEKQVTDDSGNTFKNKAGQPEEAGTELQDKTLKYTVTSAKTGLAQLTVKECIDEKATTLTIPDEITLNEVTYKVTGFDAKAFKKNKKIKKIVIGANVTSIPKNAFKGYKNLRTIVIKTKKLKAKSVAKGAFKGLGKGVTIKTPKGKKKAYKSLFRKKGLSGKVKVK